MSVRCVASFCAAGVIALLAAQPAYATSSEPETTVTVAAKTPRAPRFNSTGRRIVLDTPLRVAGRERATLPLIIEPDDRMLIESAQLAELVQEELNEGHRAAVLACLTQDRQIDLAGIRACGLEADFNSRAMEFAVDVPTESANVRTLGGADVVRQADTAPAIFSGYLNYDVSYEQDWLQEKGGVRIFLDGATRYAGVVLEAEAMLDGPVADLICPLEAKCDSEHSTGLKRRGTRFVYDSVDDETRYTLGDVASISGYSQRLYEIAGLQLQHDPRAFGADVRQSANQQQMLTLDGPTDVEIVVNGVQVQRLRMQQGVYSLRDLPMAIGSNDVQVILTDQYGNRDVRSFVNLTSDTLLAPGVTQWSLASGLPSYWDDGERAYLADDVQTHAYLRHGISKSLTGMVNLDADLSVVNSGIGIQALSPLGFWSVGVNGSYAIDQELAGASVNFTFETFRSVETNRVIRLTGEYRMQAYFEPGSRQRGHDDVLYPVLDSPLRLTATWSEKLLDDWDALLLARYRAAGSGRWEPGAVSTDADRWIVEAGASRSIANGVTAGMQVGYGNEQLLTFGNVGTDADFRVGGWLSVRLDGGTSISARHDTATKRSTLNASQRLRTEDADWSAFLSAQNAPDRGSTATANLTRMTDRGLFNVAHVGVTPEFSDAVGVEAQRSRIGYSGSLAFADGLYTAGAPITGGFAIVAPHDSIRNSTVIVGDLNRPRATGSSSLPALIPDLPAYRIASDPLDATDLPTGYSLGRSGFAARSPYKAGHAIVVGSDHAVSAVGTLKDTEGHPASLVSGIASSEQHQGHSVSVFTNRAGRFAADGLAPGEWTLVVADVVYTLNIPSTAVGYHDAGTLTPSSAPISR